MLRICDAVFIRFDNARFVICSRAKIQEYSFQSVALQWEVRESQELTVVLERFRRLRNAEIPSILLKRKRRCLTDFVSSIH